MAEPVKSQDPGQDLLNPSGQAEQGQAPESDKPLTRKELEDLLTERLGAFTQNVTKAYEGIRKNTDKKFQTLQEQFQQAAAATQTQNAGDGYEERQAPAGYDFGTETDRELAQIVAERRNPGFDYSKIEALLNDPDRAPQYVRVKPDGRTLDWANIYSNAWRDVENEQARELLAKQREQEAEANALRAQQKTQAVISGSDASYPEGVKIPRTKEEARSLTDEELAKAMVTQFNIPAHEMPDFVKENLKKG